jgi:hypothetical protein
VPRGYELCSPAFVSGPGWAWRVTAELRRSRTRSTTSCRALGRGKEQKLL